MEYGREEWHKDLVGKLSFIKHWHQASSLSQPFSFSSSCRNLDSFVYIHSLLSERALVRGWATSEKARNETEFCVPKLTKHQPCIIPPDPLCAHRAVSVTSFRAFSRTFSPLSLLSSMTTAR